MTRDVERLSQTLGAPTLRQSAVDIADLYAAAGRLCDCIDQFIALDASGRQDAVRIIGDMRAWIMSEILPHSRSVEKKLKAVLDEL